GTPALRLREKRHGLLEREREDLRLGLEAPRLLPLLDVRPVSAVLCEDVLAVRRVLADRTREGQQHPGIVERERRRGHALEEARRLRLLLHLSLRVRLELAELHVRTEPAGLQVHG